MQVLIQDESFVEIVRRALHGWKRKRIKRAMKQIRRNIRNAEGVSFELPDDCVVDPRPLSEAAADEDPPPSTLPPGEYTGDIAGLIDDMIEDGRLNADHTVSKLMKKLRNDGRNAAADIVQMALNRFNGDVNESVKVRAFQRLLDRPRNPGSSDGSADYTTGNGDAAPGPSRHATDPAHSSGPRH